MKYSENKNINKEKEKNIEEIYMLLKNLNEKNLELVRHFARGLIG